MAESHAAIGTQRTSVRLGPSCLQRCNDPVGSVGNARLTDRGGGPAGVAENSVRGYCPEALAEDPMHERIIEDLDASGFGPFLAHEVRPDHHHFGCFSDIGVAANPGDQIWGVLAHRGRPEVHEADEVRVGIDTTFVAHTGLQGRKHLGEWTEVPTMRGHETETGKSVSGQTRSIVEADRLKSLPAKRQCARKAHMVLRTTHTDGWSDQRGPETARDLYRQSVATYGVDQKRQVGPVLLDGSHRDHDGCTTICDRLADLGPRHFFQQDRVVHGVHLSWPWDIAARGIARGAQV